MSRPSRRRRPFPRRGVTLPTSESIIHLSYRDGTGVFHADWPISEIEQAINDQSGLLWVDIQGPDEHTTDSPRELALHSTSIFIRWRSKMHSRKPTSPRSTTGTTISTSFFTWPGSFPRPRRSSCRSSTSSSGKNYLITYHTEPLPILDQDRQSIERDPRDRLRQGADHLLIRFLELAIDQSLAAIEELDEQVDAIQNAVIENATHKNLRAIFRIKRSAIQLHKMLSPQREVLNRLARDPYKPIQPKHRVYFRDLYDHVVRIHDISESLRDLISGTLETYLSVVANRTNDIMKTLTIVTVMFMPMTFIVGFLRHELLRRNRWRSRRRLPRGLLFWGSNAIMAISPCFIWWYARRKKWF